MNKCKYNRPSSVSKFRLFISSCSPSIPQILYPLYLYQAVLGPITLTMCLAALGYFFFSTRAHLLFAHHSPPQTQGLECFPSSLSDSSALNDCFPGSERRSRASGQFSIPHRLPDQRSFSEALGIIGEEVKFDFLSFFFCFCASWPTEAHTNSQCSPPQTQVLVFKRGKGGPRPAKRQKKPKKNNRQIGHSLERWVQKGL